MSPIISLAPALERLGYDCVVISNDAAAAMVAQRAPSTIRFLSLGSSDRVSADTSAAMRDFFSPRLSLTSHNQSLCKTLSAWEKLMLPGILNILGPGSTEQRPDVIVGDAMTMVRPGTWRLCLQLL